MSNEIDVLESEVESFISQLIDGNFSARLQTEEITESKKGSILNSISKKLNELASVLEGQAQQHDDAQKIAKIGTWSYELKTGKISWSKELFNMHPVSKESGPPDFLSLCQMIHPDDRARFQSVVENCINNGIGYHSLHRIIFPDRIIWMDAFGQARFDDQGNIAGLLGTAQDVTDQVEREELSRFILDALQIGVWKFNPNDQSLFWDKSMYEIFDAKAEDFSGHYQAWEGTLTPEAKAIAVKELGLALSGEKEFNTTFEIQTKSRGRRYISGRGKVIRDSSGKPLMMYGVNIDVTAAEAEANERERVSKFLEVVLQNIPSMIFAKDCKNDFQFTMLNKAGEQILGLPATKFIGKTDYDLFSKERADSLRASDLETLKKGKAHVAKDLTIKLENGIRTLQTVKFPIYDEAMQPAYVIGISNDITDDLKIKADLESERTKSFRSAKLASLGEMSAGIAHEINNPLAIISSATDLLEKFKDNPEKFSSKIESIKKASHRISRIVQGLKKFSRTDEKSTRQPHDLGSIISEALILTEAKAKQNSIVIEQEVRSSTQILCDEVEIVQVVVNLISNAIDAIKNQSEKWIRISVFEEGALIVLKVQDSGPGISQEVRERLFEPFFTTKKIGEGTGLGLSITKGILDEHGASIVLLENSKNTCFEIHFSKRGSSQNGI